MASGPRFPAYAQGLTVPAHPQSPVDSPSSCPGVAGAPRFPVYGRGVTEPGVRPRTVDNSGPRVARHGLGLGRRPYMPPSTASAVPVVDADSGLAR